MLKIKQTKQFKKSLKRITKQGKNIDKMLKVIQLLVERKELPSFLKDHELRGRKWNGILLLVDTGSHAQMLRM